MRTFFEKALAIALDALASVAALITIGMLAVLVAAFGALFGFVIVNQSHFSDSLQYGVMALCALLMPVLVGLQLWRRVFKKLDDEPPRSS